MVPLGFGSRFLLPADCAQDAYLGPFITEAPSLQRRLGLRPNTWEREWYFSSPPEGAGRHRSFNTVVTTCSRKGHGQTKGLCVTSGCEGCQCVGLSGTCQRRGFRLHKMASFRKLECVVWGPVCPSSSSAFCPDEGPRQHRMRGLHRSVHYFLLLNWLLGGLRWITDHLATKGVLPN